MAERLNDIQAQRDARAAEFAGLDEVAPADFTDIGSPPLIDTEGVAIEPQWSIEGVAPQRVDIFEPVIEEPIERWVGRPRPAGFEKAYTDIDAVLDADFIYAEGLTYSTPIATWIGYYPGLCSGTQLGKDTVFAVGLPVTLIISGVSLAGTAWAPNYPIFGQDGSIENTQFRGTITVVGGDYITATVTTVNRTVLPIDPEQTWSLTRSGSIIIEEGV